MHVSIDLPALGHAILLKHVDKVVVPPLLQGLGHDVNSVVFGADALEHDHTLVGLIE